MATSRRKFIVNGLSYVSLGLTMPAFLKAAIADDTMMMSGAAAAAGSGKLPPIPAGKILVVIEMSGGNDGLNTLIPYADAAYAKLRPNIGLKAEDVVKISDKLALHPRMTAFGKMFEKGEVAVVAGAGYPNPNRSHFESMDIWQSGDPSRTKMERSGWMARYFDADGHFKGNPLSGVVLGSSMPLALTSHSSPVSVIGNGTNFGDSVAMMRSAQPMTAMGTTGGTVARSNADFIRNVGNDIYTSSQDIKKAMNHYDDKAALAAAYPNNNGLAQSLQTVAKLITGGLGTRIYYLSTGGFDTHANQPPQHANILGGLSEAVAAFRRDLAFAGRDKDVMVMTFSEFGRRAQENGSAGTDHGAASAMFVIGGGTKGGIFGEQPSLTDLDDGDLRFTTDFRRVYSTVLDKWLLAPSTEVLGGTFAPLKFL